MAKSPLPLTVDCLKQVLSYDPETGVFTWLIRMAQSIKVGDAAGTIYKNGYRYITIYRKRYFAHRLAWFYVNGAWPTNDLDHINHNLIDNRIANLRSATESQNMGNSRLSKKNKSGFKGVAWSKTHRKWQARIVVNRKSIHLGRFTSAAAAAAVYEKAAKAHFGEFAFLGDKIERMVRK